MSVRSGLRFGVILAMLAGLHLTARPAAQNTAPLTNADIIRMVAAKLGDGIIVSAIDTAPRLAFDLGVDGLIALKQAGVSDAVITAMQKAAAAGRRAEPPRETPPPQPPPRPPSVAPSQTAGATAPRSAVVTPQEPQEPFKFFRVNPATGELMPLEAGNTKMPLLGAKMVWLVGAASPVSFTYGERHEFAVLLESTLDKLRTEKHNILKYQIEPLAVKNEKRYASRAANILFTIERYGEPRTMPGRKGSVTAYCYLFTPVSTLPPGQYALTIGGMMDGATLGAFGIVQP